MNFGLAFSYPFEDQEWPRKILIPALIFLIPIVGQLFLLGWMLDITRRVIQHEQTPLPEIDFSRQLGDGLKAFVVSFVYALPSIVLQIPVTVASTMNASGSGDTQSLSNIVALLSVCCGGLIFLYSLVMAVLIAAAMGNLAAKGAIGAGLNLSEVIGLIRTAPGPYLLTLLGAFVSGIIGSLGIIACFIGILVTSVYAMAVNGHLYGQAYNEATHDKGYATGYARVY